MQQISQGSSANLVIYNQVHQKPMQEFNICAHTHTNGANPYLQNKPNTHQESLKGIPREKRRVESGENKKTMSCLGKTPKKENLKASKICFIWRGRKEWAVIYEEETIMGEQKRKSWRPQGAMWREKRCWMPNWRCPPNYKLSERASN